MKIHQGVSFLIFWFALSTGSTQTMADTPVGALIYEEFTGTKKPLFQYIRTDTRKTDGTLHSEAEFSELDGTLVYKESADTKNGKILRYEWQHLQMQQSGTVEVRDQKSYYFFKNKDRSKSDESGAPENLVIGPSLIFYLQSNWEKFIQERKLHVRIGVPDRMTDYGFRFVLLSAAESNDVLRVELSTTNLLIALAVRPITFTFSKDGKRLLTMRGMSLLKVKRNNKWEDLRAETVFR